MQSEADLLKTGVGSAEDDVRIADEEIAQVVEDDGGEPMDDDDDDDMDMGGEGGEGEGQGEGEDEMMDAADKFEDNSIGASCKCPLLYGWELGAGDWGV